jgi:hypothetical protein
MDADVQKISDKSLAVGVSSIFVAPTSFQNSFYFMVKRNDGSEEISAIVMLSVFPTITGHTSPGKMTHRGLELVSRPYPGYTPFQTVVLDTKSYGSVYICFIFKSMRGYPSFTSLPMEWCSLEDDKYHLLFPLRANRNRLSIDQYQVAGRPRSCITSVADCSPESKALCTHPS